MPDHTTASGSEQNLRHIAVPSIIYRKHLFCGVYQNHAVVPRSLLESNDEAIANGLGLNQDRNSIEEDLDFSAGRQAFTVLRNDAKSVCLNGGAKDGGSTDRDRNDLLFNDSNASVISPSDGRADLLLER